MYVNMHNRIELKDQIQPNMTNFGVKINREYPM